MKKRRNDDEENEEDDDEEKKDDDEKKKEDDEENEDIEEIKNEMKKYSHYYLMSKVITDTNKIARCLIGMASALNKMKAAALPVIYFDHFTLGPILVLSNDKKKINNNNNNNNDNEDEDNNDHCYSIIQIIHRSLIGIVLQVMNRSTKNTSLVMKIESSDSFYLERTFPQLKQIFQFLKYLIVNVIIERVWNWLE